MREYEIVIVYDLAVNEAGGPDASIDHLKSAVERNDGTVLRTDHWGRRRLAYPIQKQLDADYVLARVEMNVDGLPRLNSELHIDEKVYRHLIVRADELPSEDISAPSQSSGSLEGRSSGRTTNKAPAEAAAEAPAEAVEEAPAEATEEAPAEAVEEAPAEAVEEEKEEKEEKEGD